MPFEVETYYPRPNTAGTTSRGEICSDCAVTARIGRIIRVVAVLEVIPVDNVIPHVLRSQ